MEVIFPKVALKITTHISREWEKITDGYEEAARKP
jgi:hypothetical protein